MPKVFDLISGDEMSKDQALRFYYSLHKSVFEKELNVEEKEKFWKLL